MDRMDRLERVILPSSLEDTTLWEHSAPELLLPEPPDLKIFTILPCQKNSWPGLSTLRLLSNFYQMVTFSIRYSVLSADLTYREHMLSQWYTLRDRIITLNSDPRFQETKLDSILQKAIHLFVSDELDSQSRHRLVDELRLLLLEFRIEIYGSSLLGALIWCLVVGARRTSPGNVRKWYMMQLMRISCPLSLDYYTEVSNNLNVILTGLDTVGALARVKPMVNS